MAAIGVVGKALERLTERGVIEPSDFSLVRFLYDVVAHDAPIDVPWTRFFGGLQPRRLVSACQR